MLINSSLTVYDHLSMFPLLGRVDVWDEYGLQAQVKTLVLGVVRQEEKSAEAQGDEGTEDEQQDELLREPQGSAVVRKGGGARRQRGYTAPRER